MEILEIVIVFWVAILFTFIFIQKLGVFFIKYYKTGAAQLKPWYIFIPTMFWALYVMLINVN